MRSRKELSVLKNSYGVQKGAAKIRKILWLFTFEQWLKVWDDSGKLLLRGRKRGQYCMARFDDMGPYSVANVKIILAGENVSEGHVENISEEHKQAISIANTGRILTADQRQKISIKKKGIKLNLTIEQRQKRSTLSKALIFTEEHKKNMSLAAPRGPNPKKKWSDERKANFSKSTKNR